MAALETSLRGEIAALETSLTADIAALHATVLTAGWAIGIGVAIMALPRAWEFIAAVRSGRPAAAEAKQA